MPIKKIKGKLWFENGHIASQQQVFIYRKDFGKEVEIGKGKSSGKGEFDLSFDVDSKVLIYVIKVESGDNLVTLTAPKNLGNEDVFLNLVVPNKKKNPGSEYKRLNAGLDKFLNDKNLADAQENDQNTDLSLLYLNSGWDARLISLASKAEKLSAKTDIDSQTLYGLFRTGLPSTENKLASLSSSIVRKAIEKSNKSGITKTNVDAAVRTFDNFKEKYQSKRKLIGGIDSISSFLDNLDIDDRQKKAIIQAYTEDGSRGEKFWNNLREQDISKEAITELKNRGKLAYLTMNNGRLSNSVVNEVGGKMENLVSQGYHNAKKWQNKINEVAQKNGVKVDDLIPDIYDKGKTEERLKAYSEDLARKVNYSFPTQHLSTKINKNDFHLRNSGGDELIKPVKQFLANAVKIDKNFVLGDRQLGKFIKDRETALTKGIEKSLRPKTISAVKTLGRQYQMTADDASMKILQDIGLNSAFDVIQYEEGEFVHYFGDKFESNWYAKWLYRRAKQISNVTYNFFGEVQGLNKAVPITTLSPDTAVREESRSNLLKQFPTLEGLFGSLDYCECEHCKSVLSPAAYFVDLLKFLEREERVWDSFESDWNDKNQENFNDKYKRPFDLLIERRPDLQHLELTCENTNTVLPYIDVVNEILEFYIANNNALNEDAAKNTISGTDSLDLEAEPQNIIPEAYDFIDNSLFPISLPYDYWLDLVRNLTNHFKKPFWSLLRDFRKLEVLDAPNNSEDYGLRRIYQEQLELSNSQLKIFVEKPTSEWHELYGFSAEASALNDLTSAKLLSRKLGLSYKEIVRIFETRFINPNLSNYDALRKLGITISNIYSYKDHQDYPVITEDEKDEIRSKIIDFGLTEEWLDENWDNGNFENILVLHDKTAACNFDSTTVKYANGDAASRMDYLKINLFVRLKKYLNKSIEDLDEMLMTFIPSQINTLTEANIKSVFKTILLNAAHLKTLESILKLKSKKTSRILSFWTDINTVGKYSLYAKYFLNPLILKEDSIFQSNIGQYLKFDDNGTFEDFKWEEREQEDIETGFVSLNRHINVVKSALNLSTNDIELILKDLGEDLTTAALNIPVISQLIRYKTLSEGLSTDLSELIKIKRLTGINPFKPLHNDIIDTAAKDHAFNSTIKFVEYVLKFKASNLSIEEIAYALMHDISEKSKFNLDASKLIDLLKSIVKENRRIDDALTNKEDFGSLSEKEINQLISKSFSGEIGNTVKGLRMGTHVWEVSHSGNILPNDAPDPALFSQETDISLDYDEIAQSLGLSYSGLLKRTRKTSLIDFIDNQPADKLSAANKTRIKAMLDDVHNEMISFFDANLQFLNPTNEVTETQMEKLFDTDSIESKKELVSILIQYLNSKLKNEYLLETFKDELDGTSEITTFLLDVVKSEAQPFIDSLRKSSYLPFSILNEGNPVINKASSKSVIVKSTLDGHNAAKLIGYVEFPSSGNYRMFVNCKKAGTRIVKLTFDHVPDPLISNAVSADALLEFSEQIYFKANTTYRFVLETENIQEEVSLMIQGDNVEKGDLDRFALFSESTANNFISGYQRIFKSNLLIQSLELSEREVAYFTNQNADFHNFSLDDLPSTSSDQEDKIVSRSKWFNQLIDYVNLRNEIAQGHDDLIDVFEAASKNTPASLQELSKMVSDILNRDAKTIDDIVEYLNLEVGSFKNSIAISKIWKLTQTLYKFGVGIDEIKDVLTIISPDLSVDDKYRISTSFKNAIKARYSLDSWRKIGKAIFDPLRQNKRNALVQYIMSKNGFSQEEQLFEYFLIDPGMEPVVKSSRLKLAISAVQTYIQRCLLNLEGPIINENGEILAKGVSPKSIVARHWQWMKRYRVWEANRKIFLYPENWLEPEFRDDKTHLFTELEGALLQGDVSKDLVEKSFFSYLKQLEKISRLDIRTMYCESDPLNPLSNTIHTVGRTFSLPYEYFYRSYSSGEWTPWVPITSKIESNHLTMIKWKDRIHLFWITLLEKPISRIDDSKDFGGMAEQNVHASTALNVEVQLNWCEYFQGKWSSSEVGGLEGDQIVTLHSVGLDFDPSKIYIHSTKKYHQGEEREVLVHVKYKNRDNGAFKIVSKLSQPEESSYEPPVETPFPSAQNVNNSRYVSDPRTTSVLFVQWTHKTVSKDAKTEHQSLSDPYILNKSNGRFVLVVCNDPLEIYQGRDARSREEADKLISPFFYSDSLHTFFVQPTFNEVVIQEWDDLVLEPARPDFEFEKALDELILEPNEEVPIDILPGGGVIDPLPMDGLFKLKQIEDWLIQPGNLVEFEGALLTEYGKLDITSQPSFGNLDTVNPGNFGNVFDSGVLDAKVILFDRLTGNKINNINVIGESGLNDRIKDILGSGGLLQGLNTGTF